jgi:hypothetical protein
MQLKPITIFLTLIIALSCNAKPTSNIHKADTLTSGTKPFDSTYKVIHILVALCDNQYQGIVPVPPKIGNGQDPANNLYWGCSYGISSYFKASKQWTLVATQKIDTLILERLVFKHKTEKYYLVADAYAGKYIQQCTIAYLQSLAGTKKETINVKDKTIGINGNAQLLAYIGHDGLMDFDLEEKYENVDGKKREAIILACISKTYFTPFVKAANANPLVWTTGLMCPEAYTVHDAINAYINKETTSAIQIAAAKAYSKYQKCSYKAASNLLVGGW